MPPKRFSPDDPREWLNRARSNLARAKTRMPEVYLEDLCFDAQQAAEKAIKALLIAQGSSFPYIHDLARLLTLLRDAGVKIPNSVLQAGELTRYAIIARYPLTGEPVSEKDYVQAIEVADGVVRWAEAQLKP